jgi:hypothetical protein
VSDRPLRCRLGWHQWFTDSAMFVHARCCNFCHVYQDPIGADDLKRERALWERYDDPGKVAIALARGEDPRIDHLRLRPRRPR